MKTKNWTITTHNHSGARTIIMEGDKIVAVAHTHKENGKYNYAQSEKNAKVIAAAPEMLEALKEMIDALRNVTGRDCYDSGHHPCKCSTCKAKRVIKSTE